MPSPSNLEAALAHLQARYRRLAPGESMAVDDGGQDALQPHLPIPITADTGVLTLRMPRMILFDYGNTLVRPIRNDPLGGTRALLAHALENPDGLTAEEINAYTTQAFMALEPVRARHHVETHEHQFQRLVYETLGLRFDLTPEEMEYIFWRGMVTSVPTDGMEALLDTLAARGIRTGVISNIAYSGQSLRRVLGEYLPGHLDQFEFIIASSDYIYRKPDAHLFNLALRKAGLAAADVWYCGDLFDKDVVGPLGVGMQAV